MNKTKINSLQSLRCLAFLGVFYAHVRYPRLIFLRSGAWGVSVFLVLSGFLLTYNYFGGGRISDVSVLGNAKFMLGKIKNIYPLHIVSTLFFVFIGFWGNDIDEHGLIFILNVVLNLLMIQSWVPFEIDGIYSITGVSWYLSTLCFIYYVFPYINRSMEKRYSVRKALNILGMSLILEIIVGTVLQSIDMEYLTYTFPLYRFWDFYIGCNMAYVFMNTKSKLSLTSCSILELLNLLLIVCINVAPISTEYWWSNTFVFILSTMGIIWLFAVDKGVLSKMLTNRFTLYIASISAYAFLIHPCVFEFLAMLYYHIPNVDGDVIKAKYELWINITIGFILTIVFSEIYHRVIKTCSCKLEHE